MTVATAVTLLRLCAIPPLAFLIITVQRPITALVVFGLAAATDWADGMIARRWNQATSLGARLDPFVDKVFIFALILLLTHAGVFYWPIVMLVILRDVGVQILRHGSARQQPIPANRWGKLKFVLQCAGIAAALATALHPNALMLPVLANIALFSALIAGLPGIVLVLQARAVGQRTT
jgi:CDP-diacylglycerol---glycerol-3-phosphate 3-phosphatidyltransferase